MINLIRNALAHGNIYTYNNPIEKLIFIKVITSDNSVKKFQYIRISPKDFRLFLEKWFDYLDNLKIPQDITYGILQRAA